jgi:tRNA U38,U39,U40 pseudouridine synthase TruA
LLAVGRGNWSLLDLQNSLTNYDGSQINRIAPSSGLILHKVVF